MAPDIRQRKLEKIYGAALERDAVARLEFVRAACGEDEDLRLEVESLLGHERGLSGFLETPALEVAARGLADSRSSLIGRTLGHYTVTALLGTGGMGEMYAARDIRLGRTVALKIIPSELSADPERKRRFLQEAKAVSALNHPHIVTFHDLGTDGNTDFLVMEFIEGKTLSELIPPDGFDLKQALQYAIDVADALEQAHRAGIVHRDLKPGNLMVNEMGTLKVLDFGLAKLTQPLETEPITTLTGSAMILGTAHYMSPEQAQGRTVDSRSDIFSFGVVLYEMLTGRRPFQGASRASTLAAIVEQEPRAPTDLDPTIPRELERVLLRCLRKNPVRRCQHMADLRVALQELKEELESGGPAAATAASGKRFGRSAILWVAAGVILTAPFIWFSLGSARLPRGRALTRLTWNGSSGSPALSADGKLLAYSSVADNRWDIWLQQVGGANAIQVTKNPAGAFKPVLSPDGTRIVYESAQNGGSIYEVSTLGGQPRFITNGFCPKYDPDGTNILFLGLRNANLAMIPVVGGTSLAIGADFSIDSWGGAHGWCHFAASPDGKRVLARGYRSNRMDDDLKRWWVISIPSGKWEATSSPDRDAQFSPFPAAWVRLPANRTEWLVFARWTRPWNWESIPQAAGENRDLFRAAVSPEGKVDPDAEQLTFTPGMSFAPSVSAGGRIVFQNLNQTASVWTVPIDFAGVRPIGERKVSIRLEGAYGLGPSVSRDGTKVAFWFNKRVAVKDLSTGQVTPLTPELQPHPATGPIISPDGSFVLYHAPGRDGAGPDLYSVPTGGGAARKICEGCGDPKGISSDGTRVLTQFWTGTRVLIFLVNLSTGERKEALVDPDHNLYNAFYSWDGQWATFLVEGNAHRWRVYITPVENYMPAGPGRWTPLTSGEHQDNKPQLSPDANTVYFISDRDGSKCIWAQRLNPSTKHPVGEPFPIQHLHESTGLCSPEVSIARGMIVTSVNELRGDIWMMDLKPITGFRSRLLFSWPVASSGSGIAARSLARFRVR